MKYKATQVYLDPQDHARLKAEAQRRGISLAALIRELASAFVAEGAPAYEAKTWNALLGVAGGGEPTDVAGDREAYEAATMDALLDKKMRLARKPQPARPTK